MKESKQEHFLKLYKPTHDRFERFCRARVYGDMEFSDLMNETLLVAYEKLDTLKSEKAFLSFLFSISVRILANSHRKKKSDSDQTQDKLIAYSDVNANTEIDAEVYLLHRALALLPEAQREALILFEISGYLLKFMLLIVKFVIFNPV